MADELFFFEQDRKKTLESRIPELNKVVYHNKLGTQGLRMVYVGAIAHNIISEQLNENQLAPQVGQAAKLAKVDLLTDMVGEFPELQGIMGRYYAQHEGLSDDIAFAIEDHYKPRYSGDVLPRNMIGICLALADKLMTLLDMFSIGELPTGDKDPFALRRHALGIIRILIEKDLPIDLSILIQKSVEVIRDPSGLSKHWSGSLMGSPEYIPHPVSMDFQKKGFPKRDISNEAQNKLLIFIYERLSGHLREQGYTAQEVDAVLSLNPQQLSDVPKRLAAVRAFAALPEAVSLAAVNKRVGNILKKTESDINIEVDASLLQEPAEQALHQTLTSLSSKTKEAFDAGDYTTSLQILATLKSPVDTFFDHIMVNVEDKSLRNNRLALLKQLHQIMNQIADLSKLAT